MLPICKKRKIFDFLNQNDYKVSANVKNYNVAMYYDMHNSREA